MSVKPKILEIQITDPKDRKLLLTRMCELLSLDLEKEVKKLKIKSTASGITVNRNHIFDFLIDHELSGKFAFGVDRGECNLTVECPVIEAKGKIVVNAPETIKETSVDTVEETIKKTVKNAEGTNYENPLSGFKSTNEEDLDDESDDPF